MKKIAYIELDTHAEIAANFFELMLDSVEFKVDFYFSEKILKQLNLDENLNIFDSSASQILKQLSKENYDLIIIGTAHRNFNIYLKIVEAYKTAIICHNLNFCKISRFSLFQNMFKKNFQYRLKLLLKEGLFSAPNIFKKAHRLFVLDESLVLNNFTFLPLLFFKDYNILRKSIIKVVIPGNVDQKRRNYKEILKKLKGFTSTTQIKIYFLGKAKTIELQWLKDFERNKPKNISINYFTEKVSDEKFNEVMQQSNILWCPIQHETEFFSQTETYGKTKMSGNIGDSIKYGKTAIFPKNYFSRYAFLIPEEKDVEKQILNCHQNLKCDFQKKFNKEKIQKDLETVLKSML